MQKKGEAIERYASAVAIQEAEVIHASWHYLGDAAVNRNQFALYAPEQYEAPVPAQFVYLPYSALPGEPVLFAHTSTGLRHVPTGFDSVGAD